MKVLTKVLVVLGPTATGKSDLAVQLAKQFNGEVVSADSRQVYKGLDIGTGKITPEEMQSVPHHLLDVADPATRYSVSDYQRDALAAIADIHARGKLPILCGGTGFYIQSVIDNVIFVPTESSPEFRKECEQYTTEELFAQLQETDPRRASTIDQHNRVRIVRALEIVNDQGFVPEPANGPQLFETLQIGLQFPSEQLKRRIHDRLIKRIETGMIEEVEQLRKNGLSWERLNELGLEYRYCALHLQGELTREQLIEKLSTAIYQYAKRQMTWFKRDKSILWFEPTNTEEILSSTKEFLV